MDENPGQAASPKSGLLIELESGETLRVRPKDVTFLHPGPLASLRDLSHPAGEVETAWEILLSETRPISLAELAEWIYGVYNPSTAWAAWQLVEDGLYFRASSEGILPRPPQQIEAERQIRQERAREALAWQDFLQRAREDCIQPELDRRYISEIENLALGRRTDSKALRELGHAETPASAHAWLLNHQIWDSHIDPHPARLGLALEPVSLPLAKLRDEPRQDLTHLLAYAIDDQGNQDPDDALSLAEGDLWVHIADPAALIEPDSPADLEARSRGCNLYLPEGTLGMLPQAAVESLGLGLQVISPALSFRITLYPDGNLKSLDIQPSWVRVQRLTYEEAEERLQEEPFQSLHQLAQKLKARRQEKGAIEIDLPEVNVRVIDKQVIIRPLRNLYSREIVKEAMLLAGEATAQFARSNQIPFPYTSQEPTEPDELRQAVERLGGTRLVETPDLALQFALRRTQKRSQVSCQPRPHSGLGLELYGRVTSPLRRYSDLLAHQQLRAYLTNKAPLDEQVLLERLAQAEAAAALAAQAESLARQHWTLVYLEQQPTWRGEGILVEKRGMRGRVIIPTLALECLIQLRGDPPLNSGLSLTLRGIDLPELQAYFQVL